MFRPVAYAFAALGLAASLGTARAGTLTYSDYDVLNNKSVHISYQNNGVKLDKSGGSGEIILKGINGGTSSLATFCIDIADWLQKSGTFETGKFLSGTFADTVNALISNVLPKLSTDTDASSALQIAIWKAEYGNALTVSGPDNAIKKADGYIANVTTGAWKPNAAMRVATLDGKGVTQSQAYLTAVPEPGTIAVVSVGLLGLATIRRRKPVAQRA